MLPSSSSSFHGRPSSQFTHSTTSKRHNKPYPPLPTTKPHHFLPSVSALLLSSKIISSNSFKIRALYRNSDDAIASEKESIPFFPNLYSVNIPVGDRHIVYTSVCLSEVPSEPSDFFPMSVNYQEFFSAAGRTSGGFFKREGRTKDHEVLSYDGLHSPDSLAVTAAGIAVALSEVPTTNTIVGVRIGLIDDKFVVNPTTVEMENSKLDLMLAGSESGILMIEGYCDFLPEEKLLQAIEVGQEIAGDELVKVLQLKNKVPRRKALSLLEEKVLSILTEEGYVQKGETCVGVEITPDMLEDEDEEEEFVVDGEVDEGDVHIKPVLKKPVPTASRAI